MIKTKRLALASTRIAPQGNTHKARNTLEALNALGNSNALDVAQNTCSTHLMHAHKQRVI